MGYVLACKKVPHKFKTCFSRISPKLNYNIIPACLQDVMYNLIWQVKFYCLHSETDALLKGLCLNGRWNVTQESSKCIRNVCRHKKKQKQDPFL